MSLRKIAIVFCLLGLSSVCWGKENEMTAQEVIQKLDLRPLPEEGGYYRETYRSDAGQVDARYFGINANSTRVISTGIYYLVVPESFSTLHRVKSDEMFHFYAGDAADMIQIDESGNIERITIGSNIAAGEIPQVLVRRGVWQALRLKAGGKWALMGTTVAPGFEFEDFEVGRREEMINQFPHLRADITKYTREPFEKAH